MWELGDRYTLCEGPSGLVGGGENNHSQVDAGVGKPGYEEWPWRGWSKEEGTKAWRTRKVRTGKESQPREGVLWSQGRLWLLSGGLSRPLVGTDGVLKGQGSRGILGRHMDSSRNRGGKRKGGKFLGKERKGQRQWWWEWKEEADGHSKLPTLLCLNQI